ncbi:DUF927 domain-containing protein [Escherichia coli]|uniref:DUF927 domain-containing protein n=1 Tax=Escherichia coli TaxID=562 RepID=UPI00192D7CB1|nr:DUF927 domain-containing protein [Escherichia coli]EEY0630001.1 DUF927 domain-containing protein [Escherichia coli]EEY0634511.1 DUF927 domain-containing protein [Escherichia coli]EEY0669321.1 DUF927 domain-containing protein [Escherichia coli]EEY1437112.1 DUF927 domain-containing protein [Escherichia coli]EGO9579153.1 DUF927 domain-containing protein [Escherichia coli]
MKLAPNVKQQSRGIKHKETEVIIFAGSDAWSHAKQWQEHDARMAGDNEPPVWLGEQQLSELDKLQIVPEGRKSVRIFRAGHLEPVMIKAIGQKLAAAGVQDANFYPEGMHVQKVENWREYLARERQNLSDGLVIELPVKKKDTGSHSDDELKPRVESRADGVFWVTPKVDKQSGEIIRPETWLCSPLELLGTGTIGKEHYRVMRWKKTANHEVITMAIPCGGIGDRDGWRLLKDHGLNVTTNGKYRAILADWMQLSGSHEEWQLSTTTGWHFGAYIMPDGSIIGDSEKPILFTGKSAAINGYSVAGTAEGWRESVARLAGGNASMMLGVATSLAAPLIGLVGADGFGVHLFEQSSAGKTTTQNIASSLWGEPDAQRLTWYGTALGIANEAEAHNDGLLPLDEIGQAGNAREVSTSAYTLFNGSGKLQGAKDGGNREIKHWRTVAISTGEMDVETFLKSEGIKVKAGQLVRLLNVPMEKATKFHEYSNGKEHADALKDAWTANHGAAGREWVKWLAGHQQEAKDTVRECRERWRNLIPESYGEQVHRVGERFAILEAALVLSGHVTGWVVQECRDAIQHNFNAWVKEFGTGNREFKQMVEQAEAFLSSFGFSRYLPYPNTDERDLPIKELAGYRKGSIRNEDDEMRYYTFPHVFDSEIAKGFNPAHFARALDAAGMLEKGSDRRYKKKALGKIGGKQHVFYVLMFQPDDED